MRSFIRRSGSATKNIIPFVIFLLIKTVKRTGLLLCVGVAYDCWADNVNLIRNDSFEEEQNGCPTDCFYQIHIMSKQHALDFVSFRNFSIFFAIFI